jgi:hypothetical protein
MKRRLSLVSNSSSSSFIIAADPEAKEAKVVIGFNLDRVCSKKITTEAELRKEYEYNYCYGDSFEQDLKDSGVEEEYARCLKAIQEGKVLYFGWASNEGDSAFDGAMYHGADSMIGADIIAQNLR